MKFDFNKLRGRIVACFGSQSKFTKAFGVSENAFSKKMNNKTRFSCDDIIKIKDMLNIPNSEVYDYFFTPMV